MEDGGVTVIVDANAYRSPSHARSLRASRTPIPRTLSNNINAFTSPAPHRYQAVASRGQGSPTGPDIGQRSKAHGTVRKGARANMWTRTATAWRREGVLPPNPTDAASRNQSKKSESSSLK